MLCLILQLVAELYVKFGHLKKYTFLEIIVVMRLFGGLDQKFATAEFLEVLVVNFDA